MKPALLLIDLQHDYLAASNLQPPAGQLTEQAAALLAHCRQQNIPVAHVWTTVDDNPDNRMPHWKAANRWLCRRATPGHQTPAALTPLPHEAVIRKQFFSGFANSALDEFLRTHNCDTVILAGLHLHACMRATALDAYARALQVFIAQDATASDDPLHAAITARYLSARGITFQSVAELALTVRASETPPIGLAASRPLRQPTTPPIGLASSRSSPMTDAPTVQVSASTAAARAASQPWHNTPLPHRAAILLRLADLLLEHAPRIAAQITADVAKPISMSHGEIQRSVQLLRAVAQTAQQPLEISTSPNTRFRYQPLGVVAIITPFNNPLAIPIGKIAPAILFGNTVVWKPAPAGAAIARSIVELFRASGWQIAGHDLVQLLTGDQAIAAALAEHPDIDAVTLSGSLRAGAALQEICIRRHIPFQAEMGGNNAAIVWQDADLNDAANQIAAGAFGFAGQRCTANRRAIVCAACFDQFLALLSAATAALVWGDPADPRTTIGPLISTSKRHAVAALLQRAQHAGHQVIIPHHNQPDHAALIQRGPYHPPTIVICQNPSHEIVQEETFGPVLVVQRAANFSEALALCNGVRQGLAAALFSRDPALQTEFLNTARAGILKLNRSTVDADAISPFGGWKASGIGPPEHGPSNREFFTRAQSIYS